MQAGRIEFVNPTSRAMGRMTTILFRPFDIGKWFALGFSAWLATLLEGGGSGNGGGGGGGSDPSGTGGAESPEEIFQPAIDYGQENLEWIIPVAIGVVVLIVAIIAVLLWVSSRGKFMFLDNVVFNRSLIAEPWRKFKDIGNSLFRWRLIFGIIATVVFVGIVGAAAFSLIITFDEDVQPGWIAGIIGAGLVILLLSIILAYIYMLLEDFVIPMMYKHSLPATGAWRQVLSLHGTRPGKFVLYFLWRMLLQIASLFVILAAFVITCCIAACLMAIPYLGAVLALPITVFFRGLGPEFIRQFGDEYDLWEGSEDPFGFEPGSGPGPGELPMAPPAQ